MDSCPHPDNACFTHLYVFYAITWVKRGAFLGCWRKDSSWFSTRQYHRMHPWLWNHRPRIWAPRSPDPALLQNGRYLREFNHFQHVFAACLRVWEGNKPQTAPYSTHSSEFTGYGLLWCFLHQGFACFDPFPPKGSGWEIKRPIRDLPCPTPTPHLFPLRMEKESNMAAEKVLRP